MSTSHFGWVVGMRGRRILTAAALAVSLGSLVGASSVLATPKGIFAVYEQCPTSVPGVRLCQYAEITSGEFTVGPMRIPINKTIILQGGAIQTGGPGPNEYFAVPAVNGENMSKTELDVPGGLSTLIDCDAIKGREFYRGFRRHACRAFFRHDKNDVKAIVEPAANATNPVIEDLAALILEEGTGLTFPVKLHLENPLLGEDCYIGSESSPIELRLTTGTTSPPPPNHPISGKVGEISEEGEEELESIVNADNTLVDNSFSVPAAEGCGANPYLASIIDQQLDETLGLESPSGRNTAILTGTHKNAETVAVLASEKFPTTETPPPHRHHHHPHHHWWWQGR